MNTISNYWFILREFVRMVRTAALKARLKAADRIFENLTFAELEKKYAGRAANQQPDNWQVLATEHGALYAAYDTINGEQKKRLIREPSRQLYLGNRAGIYGAAGVVYNPYYNCVILETLEAWGNDVNLSTEFVKITKRPVRNVSGLSLSLLSIGAVNNYAHFLFDSLTRLTLLKHLPVKPDRYLVSGPASRWKEKVLHAAGILDKVIWVTDSEEISCEQLLFTNRINLSRHVSPFSVRTVQEIFGISHTPDGAPSRVIFASRKNTDTRKTQLEEMLYRTLPPFVEVIDFESLSMEDTIRICGECRHFLGVHGAAFANVAFCRPGVNVTEFQVLEVLPEWHRDYYKTLYDALELNYGIEVLNSDINASDLAAKLKAILRC